MANIMCSWKCKLKHSELKKTKDKERLAYLENYPETIKSEQEEVLKRYRLEEEQLHLIQSLQLLNFIQDERKRITNIRK